MASNFLMAISTENCPGLLYITVIQYQAIEYGCMSNQVLFVDSFRLCITYNSYLLLDDDPKLDFDCTGSHEVWFFGLGRRYLPVNFTQNGSCAMSKCILTAQISISLLYHGSTMNLP